MKYFLSILAIISSFVWIPPAQASACPSVEVVFARGTGEPAGLGDVGQAFVDQLHAQSYAVDYPASMAFNDSVLAGVGDAAGHIEGLVSRCPGAKIVLGGYSQGGSVAAFVTSDVVPDGVDTNLKPLANGTASHIRAVVLFAPPSPGFSNLLGVPYAGVGGRFQGKTLTICAPGDMVCGDGGDFSVHNTYVDNGSIQDAVNYARGRL